MNEQRGTALTGTSEELVEDYRAWLVAERSLAPSTRPVDLVPAMVTVAVAATVFKKLRRFRWDMAAGPFKKSMGGPRSSPSAGWSFGSPSPQSTSF